MYLDFGIQSSRLTAVGCWESNALKTVPGGKSAIALFCSYRLKFAGERLKELDCE